MTFSVKFSDTWHGPKFTGNCDIHFFPSSQNMKHRQKRWHLILYFKRSCWYLWNLFRFVKVKNSVPKIIVQLSTIFSTRFYLITFKTRLKCSDPFVSFPVFDAIHLLFLLLKVFLVYATKPLYSKDYSVSKSTVLGFFGFINT